MPPHTKHSWTASIPDVVSMIPFLLVAAFASLLLGANAVEIQAIWRLQRRSAREPAPAPASKSV